MGLMGAQVMIVMSFHNAGLTDGDKLNKLADFLATLEGDCYNNALSGPQQRQQCQPSRPKTIRRARDRGRRRKPKPVCSSTVYPIRYGVRR